MTIWRRCGGVPVAIHHTDDHLRKHGLLRSTSGWRLSPAFDLNPNPDVAEERSTSIAGAAARSDEVEGLLACVREFGLDEPTARHILREISDATRDWRHVAATNGIPGHQIRWFEDAFDGLRADFATT